MGLILKRTQRAPLDSSESRKCNDRGLASGEEEESKGDSDLDQPGKEIDTAKDKVLDREEGKRVSKGRGWGCVGDVESAVCRCDRVVSRTGSSSPSEDGHRAPRLAEQAGTTLSLKSLDRLPNRAWRRRGRPWQRPVIIEPLAIQYFILESRRW